MQIETDGDTAKVGEWVTLKIGLPNYSNIEISFGHSRTCLNTAQAIRKMSTEIHAVNKQVIERRAKEYLKLAEEIMDQ